MSGFVKDMYRGHTKDEASRVMRCFNTTTLPTVQTLGMEFAIFDRFFSSVPGPTGPNRLFALSGTSYGTVSNEEDPEIKGFPQRTMFDDIYEAGLDFKIYYSDFPISLELRNLREYPSHVCDCITKRKSTPFIFLILFVFFANRSNSYTTSITTQNQEVFLPFHF